MHIETFIKIIIVELDEFLCKIVFEYFYKPLKYVKKIKKTNTTYEKITFIWYI